MYPKYEVLLRHKRSEQIDEEHSGLIILYDEKGNVLYKKGEDNNYLFYHRSCMKPLQLASISEIIDYYNLSNEEIAVCTASHAGDDIHINTIRSIFKKSNLKETDLLCPPHAPLSKDAQKKLILENKEPSSIHHNCSGKHTAMLSYCKMKDFDTSNYNELNHPVQKKILNFVSEICEYPFNKCSLTKDGCTLPVLGTPLKNLAIGFIKVFTLPEFQKIKNAVISCPYHFGGEERTDSQIVIAGGGRLAAKVGAGNLCCVVDLIEKTCLVVKIADSDNNARGYVLTKALKMLNKLPNYENSLLSQLFPDNIKTDTGEIIGKKEITFEI